MTAELKSYIESELLPTVGLVEEDAPAITTLPAMFNWIHANLHVIMEVTPQRLSDYLLLDNEGMINKRRSIYLNQLDFYCLDLPVLGDELVMPHKDILGVLIMPTTLCPEGEFYFCTDDEWEILKAAKV